MTKLQRISSLIMCLIMLGLTAIVWYRYLPDKEYKCLTISNEQKDITTSLVEPYSVYVVDSTTTFTAYTLSVEETDETPCIGAGNNNLCELKPILAKDNIRICASRDLPLDTLIYIEGFGECVIKDRMSKKYLNTGRIDILFDNKIDAINFGIKKLNYTIIK